MKNFFLFICITAILTGCGKDKNLAESNESASEAQQTRVYKVRMSPPGYAPLNFRAATGTPQGFEHDILQEIAKRGKITFEYSYSPWSRLFTDLESGAADLLASGISITEERQAKYNMSDTYLEVDPVVIITKDRKVKSFKDLVSKPIAVKRNSRHEKWLLELNRGNSDYNVYADSSWLTVKTVINDKATATIGDSSIMGTFVSNHPEAALHLVVDDTYAKDYYGFVMRKDDTRLLQTVNNALHAMKSDGTYQQITKKWFQ